MCTVLILFYPNKINRGGCTTAAVNDAAEASTDESQSLSFTNMKINDGSGIFFRWWNSLLDIYYLLFVDSASEPIFMRVFMYWVAAMSLTRVMVLVWPCVPTLITVAVMYLLEALAIEFEGFTHKTVKHDYARKFSMFCLVMSLFSFLLAIFV
jgi:hypothetical protein